ncbi:MarR family winged helix-turn-helix transcriptional regulator [Mucilaginibacter auburnensis]|uniref:DNA-binding MarR family transcriptional regulator n=1 Tax=Mucilaginibacter auburnensis TaxID=1457233 RepID=A0A2H9VRF5_9SPHI|nr:MarR family transcriptional regulator [Mucilaginibacter auburnensis]PJJ83381.1 DNA-binding MarR family transcriptional regulator [Mucilaginibacter auburnensis]
MEATQLQYVTELRTVLTRLIKKLRKESATGQQLSLTERSTLVLLQQNTALQPTELAAMEKITNQSMSQILAHLLELGYINRSVSETDKRKAIITLSEQGEEVLKQVRSERDKWLAQAIEATCTRHEQEMLKQIIVPLEKIIEFE